MRIAVIVLTVALATIAMGDVVEGRVVTFGEPLPGVTVHVTSSSISRETVSDLEGRYRFADLPAGKYELKFELSGMTTEYKRVDVAEKTGVADQEMTVTPIEGGVFGCPMCNDEPPESIFDYAHCADHDLNGILIDAVANGDRSAMKQIEQRYAIADTYREQHRLAAVLLEHLDHDDAIWSKLAERASIALQFPRTEEWEFSAEFNEYCLARNADPTDVYYMSYDALLTMGKDVRARPLYHQALKSKDRELIWVAIAGFAAQGDHSALPTIDEALQSVGDGAESMAIELARYRTEEADAIAFKYINEADRELYFEIRTHQPE